MTEPSTARWASFSLRVSAGELWLGIWNSIWMVRYWKPFGRLCSSQREPCPWSPGATRVDLTEQGLVKHSLRPNWGLVLIFVNKLVLEQSHGPLVTYRPWQLLLYPGRIESFWYIPWGHKAFYSLALCSKRASSDTEEVGEHLLFSPSSTQVSLSWQQLLTPLWGVDLHSASVYTEWPVLLQLQEGAPGPTSAAKVRVLV